MMTQEEIRKKFNPNYDIYYAVIHSNEYVAYLGKDYNKALEWSVDSDEIIAISDGALYLYLHYDAIKSGLGIRVKEAN